MIDHCASAALAWLTVPDDPCVDRNSQCQCKGWFPVAICVTIIVNHSDELLLLQVIDMSGLVLMLCVNSVYQLIWIGFARHGEGKGNLSSDEEYTICEPNNYLLLRYVTGKHSFGQSMEFDQCPAPSCCLGKCGRRGVMRLSLERRD